MGRRVVFFDAYPHEFTGAQRATLLVMEGLRERGWSVSLAVPADGPLVTAVRAAGFEVTVLDFPAALRVYGRETTGRRALGAVAAMPGTWLRVARWLRSRADIVHIGDHRGQLLMGPAAKLARRRVVWHAHGIDSNRALNVVCAALANRVISPTRAAADHMHGIEWRRPAIVVPYAVAPHFLGRDQRPAPANRLVLSIGRLHPDKGFDVLLEAIARLRRVVDVRVQIVGGAQHGWEHHQQELLDLRRALDLDDVVEFTGYIADPLPNILKASVYVQPSRDRTESQGIALLEAMALGVPVVATLAGGVPETVADGAFGILVAPEDPDALAAALERVLTDPAETEERAAAAHAHVLAACTPARMIDRIEAVYETL